MTDILTSADLITFLLNGGAGAFVSWLAERIPVFQRLSSRGKLLVFVVVAALFGAGGVWLRIAIGGLPANDVALLDILVEFVVTIIAVLLGSQGWHERVNKAPKGVDRLADVLEERGRTGEVQDFLSIIGMALEVLSNRADEE